MRHYQVKHKGIMGIPKGEKETKRKVYLKQ